MSEPRNARQTNQGREYTWAATGETFPSVTTILSGGIPKPALPNWAAKSVAEYVTQNLNTVVEVAKQDPAAAVDLMKGSPWRQRDAAADIGSLIHDIAQNRVLGTPIPDYEERKHGGFVRSFEMFLDDWQPEYEATEMEVFHRSPHVYAGTLDFIARLPGLGLTLGDYKTSRSGIFPETCLQLAAYRYAEFAGMPNGEEVPMPEVETCVALNIRPNGYKLHQLIADERMFRVFLYAKEVARFAQEGRRAISGPLPPPQRESTATAFQLLQGEGYEGDVV